jgi:hypothetical protein
MTLHSLKKPNTYVIQDYCTQILNIYLSLQDGNLYQIRGKNLSENFLHEMGVSRNIHQDQIPPDMIFPNFTNICKIFSQICVNFLTNSSKMNPTKFLLVLVQVHILQKIGLK